MKCIENDSLLNTNTEKVVQTGIGKELSFSQCPDLMSSIPTHDISTVTTLGIQGDLPNSFVVSYFQSTSDCYNNCEKVLLKDKCNIYHNYAANVSNNYISYLLHILQ